jgi:hypothetical protein
MAYAAAAVAVAAAAGLALAPIGARTASAATGQSYSAACPSADLVTPTLNSNLIENAGAEAYTAVTALGAPSSDPQDVPDCWHVTSPMSAPGAILESFAATVTGQTGSREFYGGYDYDSPQKSVAGITTTATQLISVSALSVAGQPFKLTGDIGGYTTQDDYATVAATFENASGTTLGAAVIGPVNADLRAGATSLYPQATYGSVPAGTKQVLITIAATGVSAGYGIDGRADNLNLTIGPGAIGQAYTAPCPAADTVAPALDANLIANPGAEYYAAVTALGAPAGDTLTVPDCWTSYSPLPAPDGTLESLASTYPGVAGSREFYGGKSPGTVAIDGVTTVGTQLINVSALIVGGHPFELSGELGGYSTQDDYSTVSAAFESANGAILGRAVLGPATEADRGGTSELIAETLNGTVPAGTTQVLITIATTGVGGGANSDGQADNLNLTIGSAAAQSYAAPCPPADVVIPALNANLIANPGAEDYTAATALGAPSGDAMTLADCWSSDSTLPAPDGTQESNASTYTGVTGSRDFYGGASPGTVAINGVTTLGSQLINVGPLSAAGQYFKLSGALGGYSSQGDYATVTATWEDVNGAALGSAVLGPVTAAQRNDTSELLARTWYGTVPAAAMRVLITIATTGVGSGANLDGQADNLNLTIGSSAAPAAHLLQTLPYAATGVAGTHIDPGSGAVVPNIVPGALYRPAGISAAGGAVHVSNTGDNVVATLMNGNTSVVAGSLEGYGETGDGINAGSATLYQPTGSAVDASGDIFIADAASNVIREITPDGVIHRFAGTGTEGSALSGTAAASAQLDQPEAVAANAAGDIFIADTDSNRVLEVSPKGSIMSVIASGTPGYAGDGQPGTAAQVELDQPSGLAVDAKGNLYIADSANNVIRRVDAVTGIITTVAGNYTADASSGGLGGFSGDGGPATKARLNDPQGVALDGAGDLFIADTFSNAIRMVTPAGTISTVVNSAATAAAESSGATAASSHLNAPGAVAVDPATSILYVADTRNSAVAEVFGAAQAGTAAGPVAPASS